MTGRTVLEVDVLLGLGLQDVALDLTGRQRLRRRHAAELQLIVDERVDVLVRLARRRRSRCALVQAFQPRLRRLRLLCDVTQNASALYSIHTCINAGYVIKRERALNNVHVAATNVLVHVQ